MRIKFYLVCLSETVYSSHFSFLVWIGENAHCRFLARDGQNEVLSTFLSNILPQLAQQPARPLLLHLQLLRYQFLLAPPLLLQGHSLLVLLEVLPLGGLQVEPRVRKRLHVR